MLFAPNVSYHYIVCVNHTHTHAMSLDYCLLPSPNYNYILRLFTWFCVCASRKLQIQLYFNWTMCQSMLLLHFLESNACNLCSCCCSHHKYYLYEQCIFVCWNCCSTTYSHRNLCAISILARQPMLYNNWICVMERIHAIIIARNHHSMERQLEMVSIQCNMTTGISIVQLDKSLWDKWAIITMQISCCYSTPLGLHRCSVQRQTTLFFKL